jgi:cytoskeleton protein RodZ
MSTHHGFEEMVETRAREKEPLAGGPGGRLRLAREQAKLTRADVGDRLRIKLEMIEAIENDDYSRSPSLVFVRGWLRAYARLVNLPADEIIAAFNKLGITDPETDRPVYQLAKIPVKMKKRGMRWFSILLILILVSLVAMWWHSQKEPPTELAAYYSMDELMGDVSSTMMEDNVIDSDQMQAMAAFDPDPDLDTSAVI